MGIPIGMPTLVLTMFHLYWLYKNHTSTNRAYGSKRINTQHVPNYYIDGSGA